MMLMAQPLTGPSSSGSAPLPPRGIAFGIPEFAAILRERGYRLITDYPALYLRVWRRAPTGAAAVRPPHPA